MPPTDRESAAPTFCELVWRKRPVHLEYAWLAPERRGEPLLVFLHEGLGSVSMWRDFPQRLCDSLNCRGLVYSRPGYGQSSPRPVDEHWAPDFMHRQALEVLPALLKTLGIDVRKDPPWLFGHSDGASIALIHAAMHSDQVAGAIVLAPHILVEDISVQSIERARKAYLEGDLRQRLARHHADPDSAFWGWNDVWLSPRFRNWSLERLVPLVECPLLAIQGLDDEYGTLEQIHGIVRRAPHARPLELADCGHSPHREQPEAVINAVRRFMKR
jgi:pimeloyl-ACP methyl ester carboxylesterase